MRAITDAPAGRARLLSFDGGGIRGLFALQYAKRIETLLREKSGNPDLVLADHLGGATFEPPEGPVGYPRLLSPGDSRALQCSRA